MMQHKNMVFALVVGAALTYSTVGASEISTLDYLSKDIARARVLPVGSETRFSCPKSFEGIAGLPSAAIRSRLGKPDFLEQGVLSDGPPNAKAAWSYFLKGPDPRTKSDDAGNVTVSSGGGFPIVTFYFDHSKMVLSATCSYAR
jgi:hypothetical protein